jgi:hypothetical protein
MDLELERRRRGVLFDDEALERGRPGLAVARDRGVASVAVIVSGRR